MRGRAATAVRSIVWALGLSTVCALFSSPALAAPRHRDDVLQNVQRLLNEWRVDNAAAVLAPLLSGRARDPEVEVTHGELQFYQGEYDAAAKSLRSGLSGLKLPAAEAQELRALTELAAASAEVTQGFAESRSPGGHFILRYRRGRDELLIPYAGEALDKAWAALGEDFSGIATKKRRGRAIRCASRSTKTSPIWRASRR